MKQLYLTSFIAFILSTSYSQKSDTVRRYFDENLVLTTRNKSVFAGVTVKQGDHWYLFAVYPDTATLIKCFFKDEELRIKDGPFTLFHKKNIKAIDGRFVNNVPEGVWKYYHENGQLKDSGFVINNRMAGTWRSWKETGVLTSVAEYPHPDSIVATFLNSPVPTPKNAPVIDYKPLVNQRQGVSISYYDNGMITDSGLYISNKRSGIWKRYYDTGQLESVGTYVWDTPEGHWQYFRKDGTLSTKEVYDKGKIKELECYDENGNSTGSFCSISKPAVAKGSFFNFKQYAMDNIYWPKELDGKNVEGTVKVQYTITTEGKLINFKVLESPHAALSKEVERFFNSLTGWYPAISHNRAIDYTTEFQLEFYR